MKLFEDLIIKDTEEIAKNNIQKKGPLEGFHFGMSNMEAQLYEPSYSEEELKQERLEIEKRKKDLQASMEKFMSESKIKFEIDTK
ncbi:hypothetical protein [Aquimarina sp. RZ0]|uniref:hypothetical protein n=1 Tax=Aquimarina sp. RZ0 TaxID=2607730 RepID=UPI0011F24AFF|nr:hypothetical protein [Aquimarina sp. RZ0]KAA1242996.1 hypothetical protein F0000_23030 [Aquimarina sp. RZ0]